jgi:adenosylcobinamide kinase/adenosylcobinamide-phosphate guanylyltransferase
MGKLILVTGGTRSGKSGFAQNLAESQIGPRYFIATCPNVDPEMDDRIRRHQQARIDRDWLTIEEEVDLVGIFSRMQDSHVCLIDCLTLWVNNLLFREEQSGRILTEQLMQNHCEAFIEQLKKYAGTAICVTNEVGMGIVPENASARLYRDLVGSCNQIMAQAADDVILVSCGIPLVLKSQEYKNIYSALHATFNKEGKK